MLKNKEIILAIVVAVVMIAIAIYFYKTIPSGAGPLIKTLPEINYKNVLEQMFPGTIFTPTEKENYFLANQNCNYTSPCAYYKGVV